MKEIFKGSLPIKLKTKAMNICLAPTLTYGCQTWTLKKTHLNKIRTCQRALERSYMNIKLKDRINNITIRKKSKAMDIVRRIMTLKWRWAGHILRVTETRWLQSIIDWYPRDKKRRRGRPYKRWSDDLIEVAGILWTRLARDRACWSGLEEAFTAIGGPYD
ncbi:unnamed protein product [Euphydryas editha]|uniref:Endonuclease-reverse transcriptase n=1 Tax=Euphydryas editha TaxID=104508 RepID=A0AAU9UK23_EUPED|nr:unnamed protein product [Euphydryas editha]